MCLLFSFKVDLMLYNEFFMLFDDATLWDV